MGGRVRREGMCCAVLSHSVSSDSATPRTVAHQAPLFMGFSRQEYWSGLPCPLPGYLPNPGIEPGSPALQVDFLPTELPAKPNLFPYQSSNSHWKAPLYTERMKVIKANYSLLLLGKNSCPYRSPERTQETPRSP